MDEFSQKTPATPRASTLETATGIPLYQQIFVIFQNKIRSGELAEGQRVMGEQEICEAFSVSRITARRALNELAQSGLVERRRGRGTVVLPVPLSGAPFNGTMDGLLENVSQIGRSTGVRVLDAGTVPAGREVADALGLKLRDDVVRAVRVREMGGHPMSYLVTHVPPDIAARLPQPDSLETPLLLLIEAAGVPVASARQTITATVADAQVAAALSITAGSPLLDVRRVVHDDTGRAVEHIRVLYRPEAYRFEMSMQRVDGRVGRAWSADRQIALSGPGSPGE